MADIGHKFSLMVVTFPVLFLRPAVVQDVYSFLPTADGGVLNIGGTAQVCGLSEAGSRDCDVTCDVTCQLMSVKTCRAVDDGKTVNTAEESVYANTTPVRSALHNIAFC